MNKKLFKKSENNIGSNFRGSSLSFEKISKTDIAVIGMAARLPGAENIDEFWSNLRDGIDSVSDFPETRKNEIFQYFSSKNIEFRKEELRFKKKGYLKEIDTFDYKFFNLTKKEASLMSPAQRIFLETAYHSIEDGGYNIRSLKGSKLGIFLGYAGGASDYLELVKEAEPEFSGMAYPGNIASVIASRLSYIYDLKGPTMLVDTACSSSMVAFNLACQALKNGDCEMAIAGGINLSWTPFEEEGSGVGILSSSGKTKSFDDSSDGTVGGEGCISILLKPLNKAVRDNDNILAVVKGHACNQDGTSIGITAPNAIAQAEVIEQAWKNAKIDPLTISYIEAHGTGTVLGDPIEIDGIKKAFEKYTDRKQFCALSAVKTNIGHLNSVAGIAGITKAVLSLKNNQIPPLLHFRKPNSKINFEDSPVYINTTLQSWISEKDAPRRCGVSSFGISGTNSHIILEEAPKCSEEDTVPYPYYIFTASAKSKRALEKVITNFHFFFKNETKGSTLENICFTASVGKEHHKHRVGIIAESYSDLKNKIEKLEGQNLDNYSYTNCFYNKGEFVKGEGVSVKEAIEEATKNADNLLLKLSDRNYEETAQRILTLYLKGADITWRNLYKSSTSKKIRLPLYPFEKERCWVSYPITQRDSIVEKTIFESKMKNHNTSNATYSTNPTGSENSACGSQKTNCGIEEVGSIISSQLRIMSQQLEVLNTAKGFKISSIKTEEPTAARAGDNLLANEKVNFSGFADNLKQVNGNSSTEKKSSNQENDTNGLTSSQGEYLQEFITELNEKTKNSKAITQINRKAFANNRFVAGYNKQYKEMTYPLHVESAKGSKITDVDGNEYIDFCMGFGVYLLGYNHPKIERAIEEQTRKGIFLGAMSTLPGEVANLICEITGVDRVAFYNSGTEAVMLALRLARAATSKTKIAMFVGSYHGTYDGVLAQKDLFSKNFKAVPKSTGIPQSILDEVLLLEYGTEESLEIIREHAHDLAAVLVEPVQSRRPEFQPREYLQTLRKITEESKVVLIFDEIITGFRIHPGGAQKWFDVKADLVTYGKIAGGGLPIGIIAGKEEFMLGVDGGFWQFGDNSHPKFDHRKTFVAGTFCHHPLAMAAAKSMLLHLKSEGEHLQETLNQKTNNLAITLNEFFESESFNVSIVNFGSLFQIRTNYDLSLIINHFLLKGIYAWEGMTFFVSSAHSDEDLNYLIKVFKQTLIELREKGFIRDERILSTVSKANLILEDKRPSLVSVDTDQINSNTQSSKVKLTEEQRRLWFMNVSNADSSSAFNSFRFLRVSETIDQNAFKRAVQKLMDRHELLRATSIDGDFISVQKYLSADVDFKFVEKDVERGISDFVETERQGVFTFSAGPFFKVSVLNIDNAEFVFALLINNIIADGWSINLILKEISELYRAESDNEEIALPEPVPFSEYLERLDNYFNSDQGGIDKLFWSQQFSDPIPSVSLPINNGASPRRTSGSSYVLKLNTKTTKELKELSKSQGSTLFVSLLTIFNVFLHKLSGSKKIAVGIPSSGQLNLEIESLVGCCSQILPFCLEIDDKTNFTTLLNCVKSKWLEVYKHRKFSYTELISEKDINIPELELMFNMDSPVSIALDEFEDEEKIYKKEPEYSKYKLFLNVSEVNKSLKFTFQYNSALFDEEIMGVWVQGFQTLVHTIVGSPGSSIEKISIAKTQIGNKKNEFNLDNTITTSLFNQFKNSAFRNSSLTAIRTRNENLTYNQLEAIIALTRSRLQKEGVTKGSVVGVLLTKDVDIVCTAAAINSLGAVYVLIEENEINNIERHAEILSMTCLVTEEIKNEELRFATIPIVNVEFDCAISDTLASEFTLENIQETYFDTLKIVIGKNEDGSNLYVHHSNKASLKYYDRLLNQFSLTSNENAFIDKGIQNLGVRIDLALAFLLSGRPIVLGGEIQKDSFDFAIQAMFLSVNNFEDIIRRDRLSPSNFNESKIFILSDSPLLGTQVINWKSAGYSDNVYYSATNTLTSKIITFSNLSLDYKGSFVLPLGNLIEPQLFEVSDSRHQVVPVGVFGSLFMEVENVSDEITSFQLGTEDNPREKKTYLKVAENCRFIQSNNLELNCDRNSSLFKIALEESVKILENVDKACLVNRPGTSNQNDSVLFVSFNKNRSTSIYEVEELIKRSLNSNLFLPKVVEVPDSSFSADGSIDEESLLNNVHEDGNLVTEVEQKLLSIFQTVLKTKSTDLNTNFFEEGGNSLKAIHLVSKVHLELGVKLELRKIFSHPTVAELYKIIKSAETVGYHNIAPVKSQLHYEVSNSQKRIWILDQLEESKMAYIMPKAYILKGSFDVDIFSKVLYSLVERHEILRTVFRTVEGELRQIVLAPETLGFEVEYKDLSHIESGKEIFKDIVEHELKTPFDLSQGPLLRAKIVYLGNEEFGFAFSMHHIIADGWSMELLIDEILRLYSSFKKGESNPLATLNIQYKDYVHWQSELLKSNEIKKHKDYWLNLFKDDIPVLNLPLDYPRPAVKSYNGAIFPFHFDKQQTEIIKAISKKYGVSIYNTLLTFTKILLYKYSGQNDLVVGAASSGRDHLELENQIGIYLNTLVFRTKFDDEYTFEELLQVVKEAALNAYEHQIYPFDQMVEDLDIPKDFSRSPLFDVMVELDDIDLNIEKHQGVEGVEIEYFSKEIITSKYDLSFKYNSAELIIGNIEFNRDLFTIQRVEKMVEHLKQIILDVDRNLRVPLNRIAFLTEDEKHKMLESFNDTTRNYSGAKPFIEEFEQIVLNNKDKVALEYNGKSVTYEELDNLSNNLAQELIGRFQIKPNDLVAVMAPRTERVVIALLAILKSGAAFLPIDPNYPKERIRYIISESEIKLMISETDFMMDIPQYYDGPLSILDVELDILESSDKRLRVQSNSEDLAYVIYTSGSTGRPKGVKIAHENFMNYLLWVNEFYFKNSNGRIFPLFTSLTFDLTITCIFSTFLRGDKLVVFDDIDINKNLTNIFDPATDINVVKLTPSHISLLRYLPLSTTNVTKVIVGGEALTSEHIKILRSLNKGIEIYNEYGPTEATVGCIVKEVINEEEASIIGKPIANTKIYILDGNLNLLPTGIFGEIYIAGKGVARGYLNNQELTEERFIKNPYSSEGFEILYKTGDYAKWLEDGEIDFLGRKDEQVKIRGYRIELSEIEKLFLQQGSVKEILVTVVKDQEGESLLAAYHTADAEVEESLIRAYLKERLPYYMIPTFLTQIEKFPLTPNGKIDKKGLPSPFGSSKKAREVVLPRNAVEQKIASIWSRVLSRERIGVNENFFELGGHSLKATQVISEIFKALGVNIELSKMFSYPTIEQLGGIINSTKTVEYQGISPLGKQEYYDASYAQNRLWILEMLEKDSVASLIPDAYMIEGDLNIPAFKKAFEVFISRHESLRTTFEVINDELKQKIHDAESYGFELQYIDLSRFQDGYEIAKTAEIEERKLPFDLQKGPLIRTTLFQLEEKKFLFLLTMHHIISDGWSFEILINEITTLYQAFSEGRVNPLDPLKIQYKDFVAWQNAQLQGENLKEHKEFWLNYLRGDLKVLEIPTDYNRKGTRTYNGDTVKFLLDSKLSQDLNRLSQINNCSLFMLISSIINLVLYKYTWQKDIVIGFPIAGRNNKELENQIGLYLNTLVLRTHINVEDSFSKLVLDVKTSTLDVYKHQLYPFDLLVEDLNLNRLSHQSPLFDLGITWQNQMGIIKDEDKSFERLNIYQVEEENSIAKHDLWFYGSEIGDQIGFRLRYNSDLYFRRTIENIKADFITLCEEVVSQPDKSIHELLSTLTQSYFTENILIDLKNDISEDF